MDARRSIVFYVNDRRIEVSGKPSFQTLAEFLRHELRLTGTKIVCAEGDCGACTVLLASIHEGQKGTLRYKPVNSCILPLYVLDGSHLITVEGLKDDENLHPVQKALVDHFGTQCGYCTPGIACSMAGMVEDSIQQQRAHISEKRARNCLTGNLCRCTGYEPILNAAQSIDLKKVKSLAERYQDLERNAELHRLVAKPVTIEHDDVRIYLPTTLQRALELKKEIPDLKIIGGSTDSGVLVNKGRETPKKILSLQHVPELRQMRINGDWLEVGPRVTLTAFQEFAETDAPELGRLLHIFASPQIKNQATLVGNVVNASPIGDTIPFLMVTGAQVQVQNISGTRAVPLEEFYLGYKKLDLKPDELVTAVRIHVPNAKSLTRLYKVSRRKDLDISAVTFAARIERENGIITEARIALGGVGPTVMRMKALEQKWKGAKFERSLFEESASLLPSLIKPLSDVRGSSEFRMKVCQNLFLKFHDEVAAAGRVTHAAVSETEVTS